MCLVALFMNEVDEIRKYEYQICRQDQMFRIVPEDRTINNELNRKYVLVRYRQN